jgi:hypothetical protein
MSCFLNRSLAPTPDSGQPGLFEGKDSPGLAYPGVSYKASLPKTCEQANAENRLVGSATRAIQNHEALLAIN